MTEAASGSPAPRPGLRGLDVKPGYDSGDRALEAFYVPVLSRATSYGRSVGWFRSSALSVAARGLSRFINSGGQMRLLCGAEISPADRDALLNRSSLDGAFAERLAARLVTGDEVARRRLEVLAWLARERRLEVRIAIAVDDGGDPLVGGGQEPYFHEKIGVLHDADGDGIAFQGSVNESATAWARNFESFSVYCSWDATATHFSFWANKFEEHWSGHLPGFRVFPLPEAARQRLLRLAPDTVPGERDLEEPPPLGDDAVVARYLLVAPRLVSAEALAEATTGVELFPHQRQVVERLAGLYPRAWLVADEVGLGKTISAGMALRRLLLAGRVRRALILAPANVCRQWQDELFEKLGLWVPRLDSGRVWGAHPREVRPLPLGANPYAEHPVLIASSHLARRREQQRLLLEAARYDVLVIDEAHHARRSHAQEGRYRPGRLLELLDKVTSAGAARALWLLTATPMQVDPVELRDLLVHAGLSGALAGEHAFERYARELGKDDGSIDWVWLDRVLRDSVRLPLTGAERALLEQARSRVGPVETSLIERFGTRSQPPEQIVEQLSPAGRQELRRWLRAVGPVGQLVTRHSRATLRRYREQGLLTERLAERDVQPVLVPFDAEEQRLYDLLDDLIDRLMQAHGSRRAAGFVLTVYRRRLTSSWAAIRQTLTRRLNREALSLDDDLIEEAEAALLDTGTGGEVDAQAVPLTDAEIAEIRRLVARMAAVTDSKFRRLQQDLDTARGAGHSTVVFTQFTDTLEALRDRLVGAYRSQLATFTGGGGQVFREAEGWVAVSKRDLVDAIRARRVTVLVATDAASEGLNLQACSYLVNYDMPWNPMRVEQRIGRIDRLGQAREVVHVRSYFVPGTVEESVYQALAGRIDDFSVLLGNLQPILGATERAFQAIFRTPRSERRRAADREIDELLGYVDRLEREGVALMAEDPLPLPVHPPSPVTLADLRRALADRFAAVIDEPDRPVTFDPARASRDPDAWTALATYGHPRLKPVLQRRAGASLPDSSGMVVAGGDRGPAAAVRADRTPPEPIRSVADVDSLGPPAARGDAEALASRLVQQATHDRLEAEAAIVTARHRQSLDNIRERFLTLARETVAAGCAAARTAGNTSPDPVAVWRALTHDPTSPWAYADTLRNHLDVPLPHLLPERHSTLHDLLPAAEWSALRSRNGTRLHNLMTEYRAAVGASPRSG